MPFYEFQCGKCGKVVEQFVHKPKDFSELAETKCDCGGVAVRLVSRVNFSCHVEQLVKK